MKTYGAVPVPLWDNPRYLALSPHAKFVLVYSLTGRHSTMLGCFRLPLSYIVSDIGLSLQEAEAAIQEVIEQQFFLYDKKTSWLLIPEYLDWNTIDNPNQGINIAKQFAAVPKEISLYPALVKIVQAHDKNLDDAFKAELAKLAELIEQGGLGKPPLAEEKGVWVTPSEETKGGLGNPLEKNLEGFRNHICATKTETNNPKISAEIEPSSEDVAKTSAVFDEENEQIATNSATTAFSGVWVTPLEEAKGGLGNPPRGGLGNPLEKNLEGFRNQYQYQEQYQYQKQEQEQKEKTSAELAQDATSTPTSDVVISLPLVGNKEWVVHQQQVEEWQQLYPAIDVVQVLRNIRGWNLANPKRRKTKSGILRHVTSWLAKEQDRGGVAVLPGGLPKAPGRASSLYEYNLEVGRQWLAQQRVINGEATVCN